MPVHCGRAVHGDARQTPIVRLARRADATGSHFRRAAGACGRRPAPARDRGCYTERAAPRRRHSSGRSGETGRRAGLKIRWALPPVWVRFPPPAPRAALRRVKPELESGARPSPLRDSGFGHASHLRHQPPLGFTELWLASHSLKFASTGPPKRQRREGGFPPPASANRCANGASDSGLGPNDMNLTFTARTGSAGERCHQHVSAPRCNPARNASSSLAISSGISNGISCPHGRKTARAPGAVGTTCL